MPVNTDPTRNWKRWNSRRRGGVYSSEQDVTTPLIASAAVLACAPGVLLGQFGQFRLPPPQPEPNFSCVERIDIPNYPPMATAARVEGTVSAKAVVGRSGVAEHVRVDGGLSIHDDLGMSLRWRFLVPPVEAAVRNAVFHRACSDKTVTLVFTFTIIGNRSDHPTQRIEFNHPNIFRITSEIHQIESEELRRLEARRNAGRHREIPIDLPKPPEIGPLMASQYPPGLLELLSPKRSQLPASFQPPVPSQDVPVLTVCEALTDLGQYNGMAVVLVGKLVSTSEGRWLSEDCEQKLVTEGYTWSSGVWLTFDHARVLLPTMPKDFTWDNTLLETKLRQVQRTTKLHVLQQFNYAEQWFAFFGRFETRFPPEVVIGGDGRPHGHGCGHLSGAPAQLISGPEAQRQLVPQEI